MTWFIRLITGEGMKIKSWDGTGDSISATKLDGKTITFPKVNIVYVEELG